MSAGDAQTLDACRTEPLLVRVKTLRGRAERFDWAPVAAGQIKTRAHTSAADVLEVG